MRRSSRCRAISAMAGHCYSLSAPWPRWPASCCAPVRSPWAANALRPVLSTAYSDNVGRPGWAASSPGLSASPPISALSPLGVTAETGSHSRQLATPAELLPSRLEGLDSFRGCATIIRDALLTPNGLFVAGLVVAALTAALIAGEFKARRPTGGQALRGLIGGILLDWGSVVGLHCTSARFFRGSRRAQSRAGFLPVH